eukprot:3102259-Rhodomonas_salina.3
MGASETNVSDRAERTWFLSSLEPPDSISPRFTRHNAPVRPCLRACVRTAHHADHTPHHAHHTPPHADDPEHHADDGPDRKRLYPFDGTHWTDPSSPSPTRNELFSRRYSVQTSEPAMYFCALR